MAGRGKKSPAAADDTARPGRSGAALRWGWRLLALFWAATAISFGTAAGALILAASPAAKQAAAPPVTATPAVTPTVTQAVTPAVTPALTPQGPAPAAIPQPRTGPPSPATTSATPASQPGEPIPPPQSALLEPSTLIPDGMLPRIATDGTRPSRLYAAGSPPPNGTPRIALLLAGLGMNEAESMAAIRALPATISLAMSPYAPRLDALLARARDTGHEIFLSIPMEPQGYPLNDPGDRALLTGASLATNAQRLEWALTRFAGYVGATGALGGDQGGLRGERFGAALDQMLPLLETLGQHGLLYVDPRPNASWAGPKLPASAAGRPPLAPSRGVDLAVDEQPGPDAVDAALVRLEVLARKRGAAIGLIGLPSPVAVERVGVWALGLPARGASLAPVSAVVQMPSVPSPPARGQP